MKVGTFAYVPPDPKFHGQIFVDNLKRHEAKHPVVLYSDNFPNTVKLKVAPDVIAQRPGAKKFTINNIIFFTALRIAVNQGFTHILYIEADSRVYGRHWDDVIFDEFFSKQPALIGGSTVVYNPCNSGKEGAMRWQQLIQQNERKNYPIPTYGWKGAADATGSCVFVNGSIGVYDVRWCQSVFNLDDTGSLATSSHAWDMEIGFRLWEQYQVASYDQVAHLYSVFSSYGDTLTTEAERMAMLRNQNCVAVHQVKSDATI